MSSLLLVALIGTAFVLCVWRDKLDIAVVSGLNGWRELRIAWAPLARLWTSRRGDRHYWLRYLDERGQSVRRLCCVKGLLQGETGVFLEPLEAGTSAPHRPLGRFGRIVVGAGCGACAGLMLGIGGSLLVFPSSNIAPAYGVLLGAPLGFVVGALIGAARSA